MQLLVLKLFCLLLLKSRRDFFIPRQVIGRKNQGAVIRCEILTVVFSIIAESSLQYELQKLEVHSWVSV